MAVDTEEEVNSPSVLVLGAGIAGLAASRELLKHGIRVEILEGRDRAGGRLHTTTCSGIPIDIGASWIHGIHGNPVTELAKQAGAELVYPTKSNFASSNLFEFNGEEVSEADFKRSEAHFEKISEALSEQKTHLTKDIPLEEAYESIMREQSHLTDQEKRLIDFQFRWIEGFAASDAKDLSLKEYDYDDEFHFKGPHVQLKPGYGTIVDYLSKNQPIRYEHVVSSVTYSPKGVTVETSKGVFKADYAILTFPLGVLKRGTVRFEPPLPSWKTEAIERLGMGVLNRIVMVFPKIFWKHGAEFIGLLSDNNRETSNIVLRGFMSLESAKNAPVLVCFVSGDAARQMEKSNDAALIESAVSSLKCIYGNDAVPQPLSYVVTRWNSDPFSYGSYTCVPPGSSGEDYKSLARPVMDRLGFAGEHTSYEHPGYAHGAYLSGLREAERILTSLRWWGRKGGEVLSGAGEKGVLDESDARRVVKEEMETGGEVGQKMEVV
mmetsp:Transcript_8441/g.14234  ORF Transcript_8441/g.14234 Transcript_8441/m.14234 type:complete len:492 (-) Transcript_8441:229-1704(-)|eukprot:CAMPEP_0184361094 /NCGR_PEP_ID=MMETSP1089-20130417/128461_1 /TAXON_ID=38269 ORGANISM="Gloeochaete wittrockiana, Strain SAG46.84" /NCGR_SAMPLE_ID=MMETSP1089 /ASSEMBLY_ACC=CAM_ASM_000445 /LENGTH=491 /DNA_ID=CAMNT_0026700605 /DNA_START=106 /DNA_END=1581 /DNA_ORIENTATION=+